MPNRTPPVKWLVTKDAAIYLGISEKTLKRKRDACGGYLSNPEHYQFTTDSPNSKILWEVEGIRAEFNKRALKARTTENQGRK